MSPCVISPLNLISCLCLLLKQPLTSQMLIYNLHSLWLLLIFLPGLSTQKTSFATALPSYPPKSPSPSLIPKQQPASSPTSSSSLPASNPISPSTSLSSLIISKWPVSSPSSPSSLSPSSDYLSSSPSLSLSLPPPFPHYILLFLDKATPVCGVFLNVQKAFDSVTHSKLLKKLHSLGLPFHLINWLQSYLCSHSQSVRISNSLSSSLPVSSGVPQGSILGPILFLIFINEVGVLSLSPCARLFLFADDILLLHPLSSPSCWGVLQDDLNLITSWLTHNSLSVNPSTSKYMIFLFKSQADFDYLPPLLLNHISLERVYSFKYHSSSVELSTSHGC